MLDLNDVNEAVVSLLRGRRVVLHTVDVAFRQVVRVSSNHFFDILIMFPRLFSRRVIVVRILKRSGIEVVVALVGMWVGKRRFVFPAIGLRGGE